MAESQWRTRSRQVIARVMASVPADATWRVYGLRASPQGDD